MGFNELFAGLPGYSNIPPPAEILKLVGDVEIDELVVTWLVLVNKFLLTYSAGLLRPQYIFGAFLVQDIEALISINTNAYIVWIEISRLAAVQQRVYYRGNLIASFPDAPVYDATVYGGYLNFYPYGWTWLAPWSYRKEIKVTGPAAAGTFNYQLKIIVNRSAGSDSGNVVYVGTNCNSDFSDLRFTDQNGSTLLSYWIESVVGSVCTVWVKFNAIPGASAVKPFFMYYGNAVATSLSDGVSTFIFFDTFTTKDTAKWIWTNADVTAGYMYATADGGYVMSVSPVLAAGLSYRLVWRSYIVANYDLDMNAYYNSSNLILVRRSTFSAGKTQFKKQVAGVYTDLNTNIDPVNVLNEYYQATLSRITSSYVVTVVRESTGGSGSSSNTISDAVFTNALYVQLVGNKQNDRFDWVLLAAYSSDAPAVTGWGVQETPP